MQKFTFQTKNLQNQFLLQYFSLSNIYTSYGVVLDLTLPIFSFLFGLNNKKLLYKS